MLSGCVITIIVLNNKIGDIDAIQTKDGEYYQVDEEDVAYIDTVRTGAGFRIDGYVVFYEDKPNVMYYKDEIARVIFENGDKKMFY